MDEELVDERVGEEGQPVHGFGALREADEDGLRRALQRGREVGVAADGGEPRVTVVTQEERKHLLQRLVDQVRARHAAVQPVLRRRRRQPLQHLPKARG